MLIRIAWLLSIFNAIALSHFGIASNECLPKVGEQCCICLETLQGDLGRFFKCDHFLHFACFDSRIKKCPLCRFNLILDPYKVHYVPELATDQFTRLYDTTMDPQAPYCRLYERDLTGGIRGLIFISRSVVKVHSFKVDIKGRILRAGIREVERSENHYTRPTLGKYISIFKMSSEQGQEGDIVEFIADDDDALLLAQKEYAFTLEADMSGSEGFSLAERSYHAPRSDEALPLPDFYPLRYRDCFYANFNEPQFIGLGSHTPWIQILGTVEE